MNAVMTENLIKCFKHNKALNGITVEIPMDCIVGLIGRNGAGKTTLMKTLAGHLRPDSGVVRVFNEKPFDNLSVLSDILFMDDARYPDSVNLAYLFNLSALYYPNFDHLKADKLLKYFDISQKSRIKKLSKGTKTLFSLVLAICSRAPLTLLDEPVLGLDAAHRKEFASLLLNDFANHPRTIIISSHLISELENLMEQVVLIDHGQLIFHKAVDEVQRFALYCTGHRKLLETLSTDWDIISRDMMGDRITLGVVNRFTDIELNTLKTTGVEISAMNVQDVCVNLTATHDGGVLSAIGE